MCPVAVQRQVVYASYMNVFRVFSWIFLAGLPFLWLMHRPRTGAKRAAAAHCRAAAYPSAEWRSPPAQTRAYASILRRLL